MKPITRGRIARITNHFDIEDPATAAGQNTLNGRPTSALNIVERDSTPEGQPYIEGKMAKREEDRVEVPHIAEDGSIDLDHEDRVVEKYSAFAAVPGEYLAYWEDFATEFFRFNTPAYEVYPMMFDLNSFVAEHREAIGAVDAVGFAGRADRASKGTVYGHDLFGDEDIGDDLEAGSVINELQVTLWAEVEDQPVDVYLAASGYLEVYKPRDLTTGRFLDLLDECVLAHAVDEGEHPLEEDDDE